MVLWYGASASGTPTRALFIDMMPIDSSQVVELLTVAEVAGLLKVSVPTVRRLQQQRRLPFIKVGRGVRFAKSDVAAYVERRRVESIK